MYYMQLAQLIIVVALILAVSVSFIPTLTFIFFQIAQQVVVFTFSQFHVHFHFHWRSSRCSNTTLSCILCNAQLVKAFAAILAVSVSLIPIAKIAPDGDFFLTVSIFFAVSLFNFSLSQEEQQLHFYRGYQHKKLSCI